MKSITTVYKGISFRSRLEARWAVFFDALEIDYEYEPEGFLLSTGEKYLPDFFLPSFQTRGMYVEVKPRSGDFSKAKKFARECEGHSMWLAEGIPDCRAYLFSTHFEDGFTWLYGIPNADQAYQENRMFSSPGYENEDGSIDEDCWGCLGGHYIRAVSIAKSRKFEFMQDNKTLAPVELFQRIERDIQELLVAGKTKDFDELLSLKFEIAKLHRSWLAS